VIAVIATLAIFSYAESETIYYFPSPAEKVPTPFESLESDPSPQRIKDAIVWFVGNKELADTMVALAVCESGFNTFAWNKKDPNDGSKGLFQYQDLTFYHYAKVYKIKNPDIWNARQQIQLTSYLIRDNMLYLWTCGRRYDILNIK